ncbi:hypothetical protein KOR42_35470 [Thalassoglobus neptunius]|uniref:DUF1549 domain-containing protein n=1 Tax=Thalassoglobus neptunius TaxID=1938619 RepID=A0A5C5WN37_9PLAN|nr:DUF1549 domain-containing protein [Thalassoglobus neptunius]TWT51499.1 hypothetical protein KOR42_35470 [Thalassoglobus neptunius]
MHERFRRLRRRFTFCVACLSGVLLITSQCIEAAPPRKKGRNPANRLPDLKDSEDKLKFLEQIRSSFPTVKSRRRSTYGSADLDEQLEKYISRETRTPLAPIVDDATFVRRVYLDVAGRFPTSAEIKQFVSNTAPDKRSVLIDELLETEEFARKLARYWRTVVFSESNANRNSVNPQAFEDWLFEEFHADSGWDRMVGEMVSATPKRKKDTKPQDNGWHQDHGPNNFVLANERKPELIASATARLFMGISIGCAECHDHPFDKWKREQFHEMAAFFSPGRYYMTDQYDPSQKSVVEAKFLLGEKPPKVLKPDQRRVAGAAYLIYNPDNYWFARAFVNRVWNELLGDGFYSVDSLGPDKEVMHQLVVNRLAASFRYEKFKPKWLYRTILNSRAYQRETRTIERTEDLFTAVRPARLRPYEISDNVEQLVGENKGLSSAINRTFEQDPSIPQRDLEGSIQQALLMMNNGTLNNKLINSSLKKQLMKMKDSKALVTEAFVSVLAREPTAEELSRYEQHIKTSSKRNEAVDDILWVLVNSSEFITKR